MNQHQYQDFTIEVIDESVYKSGSADNNFNYAKVFFADGAEQYPTSKHGIKVYRDGQIVESCIVIGSGGATGVYVNASLIDNDRLLVCCCDTVFCLALPGLTLLWHTQADLATCFKVYKLQEDYLVHGEMQITRLGKEGSIQWQFGGADIFVSMDGGDELILEEDHIMLTDFGGTKYKIDFDGNLLWDTFVRAGKTAGKSNSAKTGRTWWRKLFGAD